MKYHVLTTENKVEIVTHKMRDLEATHFRNKLDLQIAVAANAEEMKASAQTSMQVIESALEICKEVLNDLQKEA